MLAPKKISIKTSNGSGVASRDSCEALWYVSIPSGHYTRYDNTEGVKAFIRSMEDGDVTFEEVAASLSEVKR